MKSTSDRRVAGGDHRQSSLCCHVISILDSFSKLSKTSPRLCLQPFHSAVGFLFVHFIVGQSSLLATFEIEFLFTGGVATYEPIILQVCHAINSLLP